MRTHSRSTFRRAVILFPFVLAFLLTLPSRADLKYKPWIEKDWTQWTQHDCSIILGGSPWNQWKVYIPSPVIASYTPSFGSRVQIRSALPIRQAVLRESQLEARYEKMKPDKKNAFDLAHAHDLDPADQVLLYIDNSSTDTPAPEPSVSSPPLARQVVLRLADGTLVLPTETNKVKYTPDTLNSPQNQFEYVFPRTVGGKPLFSPGDECLVIELGAPLVFDKKTHNVVREDFRDSGKRYTFKIADLMYKGKLEY